MSYFNVVEENKCFRRVLEKSDYPISVFALKVVKGLCIGPL